MEEGTRGEKHDWEGEVEDHTEGKRKERKKERAGGDGDEDERRKDNGKKGRRGIRE